MEINKRRVSEALNVTWLLEHQEQMCSGLEFRDTRATERSRSMLVFAWRVWWNKRMKSVATKEWTTSKIIDRSLANKKECVCVPNLGERQHLEGVVGTGPNQLGPRWFAYWGNLRPTIRDGKNPKVVSFGRPRCQNRPKALEMSTGTRGASPSLLSEAEQKCATRVSRSPFEQWDRKQYWWVLSSSSYSRNEHIWWRWQFQIIPK